MSGLEILHHKPLLRDPTSRTGVSVRNGVPIASVDDLPDHYIEVHVLRDATEASVFVSGLETAGLGNAMAYDWHHGDVRDNRVVIVARFDVPRPEGDDLADVVKVTTPPPAHELDTAARKRENEGDLARRRLEFERQVVERKDVETPVLEAGGRLDRSGDRWFQFSLDGSHGIVSWDRDGEPVEVTVDMHDHILGAPLFEQDLRETCARLAEENGFLFGRDGYEMTAVDVPRNDVVAIVRRMNTIEESLSERTKVLARERFEQMFRLTPKRKRFIETAIEDGIRVHHGARGRSRAYAGRHEFMWSEFQDMIRRGWIRQDSSLGYVVTPEGRSAIGATDPVPHP